MTENTNTTADSVSKTEDASEVTTVSYADFAKLEIKIGTITAVEVVPDADRLLKLMVDVGEDTSRQIVSGIREYFTDIEALVGKQCPFITNLETWKIRGFESQGMILAGGEAKTFTLFHPAHEVPAGTIVR